MLGRTAAIGSRLDRAKSVVLLALVVVVLGWRLVVAATAGSNEFRSLATPEHRQRWFADRESRYRWTLAEDYDVYAALKALGPEARGIMLYAEASDDPEGARIRLTLLENQLTELLFPARAVGIVGPVDESAIPRARPSGMYLVNLTPKRPFARFRAFDQVSEHPRFSLWKGR